MSATESEGAAHHAGYERLLRVLHVRSSESIRKQSGAFQHKFMVVLHYSIFTTAFFSELQGYTICRCRRWVERSAVHESVGVKNVRVGLPSGIASILLKSCVPVKAKESLNEDGVSTVFGSSDGMYPNDIGSEAR